MVEYDLEFDFVSYFHDFWGNFRRVKYIKFDLYFIALVWKFIITIQISNT